MPILTKISNVALFFIVSSQIPKNAPWATHNLTNLQKKSHNGPNNGLNKKYSPLSS
jgi:hypothetical protein